MCHIVKAMAQPNMPTKERILEATLEVPRKTIRVVPGTTGNLGKRSARAMAANADLGLVGCYDFMALGTIMTSLPTVNAIPQVVAAPPSIVTSNDLPLVPPRGVVSAVAEKGTGS